VTGYFHFAPIGLIFVWGTLTGLTVIQQARHVLG
jgi:hypothetical protein